MFTAGVSAQSPNQQAARELIKLLRAAASLHQGEGHGAGVASSGAFPIASDLDRKGNMRRRRLLAA